MSDLICSIDCSWNASGKVTINISSGSFGDLMADNLQLLSPSVPMLVSHQLGTFLPASGLALTSYFIDYIVNEQDMMLPINSVLKGAKLEFFRRSQGGVAIQFKPETNKSAKSDDIEDGARQFVYNYTLSVFEKLPHYNLIICKIFLGLVLEAYLDLIDEQIQLGRLSSNHLSWNSEISIHMTKVSINASASYKTGTPEGYNKESQTNTLTHYRKLSEKHRDICRKLDIDLV